MVIKRITYRMVLVMLNKTINLKVYSIKMIIILKTKIMNHFKIKQKNLAHVNNLRILLRIKIQIILKLLKI